MADLSLDKAILQAVVEKALWLSLRRELVPELMQRFGCSKRQALRMSTSIYLCVSQCKDESVLKAHIKEITDTCVHFGYRRVHVKLRWEGHMGSVKRVYRLYREEGLSLRL